MPTIIGTEGNDTYSHSTATSDTYGLLGGNDRLTVFAGTVQAFMGEGNDVIDLRGGTTSAYGESGEDRFELFLGAGAYGGGDNDIFNIRGGNGLVADGGSGDDRFNFAAASTNLFLYGGFGHDAFAGGNFASTGSVYGDSGNDQFTGFRSGITVFGGTGDDVFRINPGSTATIVEAVGEGSDIVQLMRGADYLLPANVERIVVGTYAGSDSTSATITMNDLANAFTGHGNDETVDAFGGNDRLFGKAGNDTLNGGDGHDLLDGGAGNDALNGGIGNDRLVGRTGDDTMAGADGNDVYYVDSTLDVVTEFAFGGTDTVRTTAAFTLGANVENGVIDGTASVSLYGNALANVMTGNSGNNGLYGYEGDDTIRGGAGDDTVSGLEGNDTLFGDAGDDLIFAHDGQDTMSGGAGNDTYRFLFTTDSPTGTPDHIMDFLSISGPGGDVLDLHFIDANTAVAGDQAFTYMSSTPTANSLWFNSATVVDNGDGTFEITLLADVNGDTTPELEIQVHFLSNVLYPDDMVL